ncbi:MAG: glycosyltransferase family 1 protein [Bacteroidota bacterium]
MIMTIAVNTRFLLPNKLEGIGWFTYEVVKRLVERHPEHRFIFLFDRPFDEQFLFANNVEPLVVFPPARHPLLWYAWFEWGVPKALRNVKADVFLSPDSYCSLRTKVPTVLVTHDIAHVHFPEQIPWLVRHYYDFYVPQFLNRAERIVTVSEFSKADMVQHYGVPSGKISVACNGSRGHFRPIEKATQHAIRAKYADNQEYFFYLGALHPRKNLERLIQAFDQFKQQSGAPTKLLIGGRFAWQTGSIKATYDEAKHSKDIHFLGYIADDELPLVMGSAKALTYVSLFEGFGMPILEAMYAEVPVISSAGSSMGEVAGAAGLLVDPTSVEAIAKAMLAIQEDIALGATLVEKGREQRQQFTWERAADVVEREVLGVRDRSNSGYSA